MALGFDIVGKRTRPKHWPPASIETASELRDYSLLHRGPAEYPGWLNPGTQPAMLVRYAQAAIALYFYQRLEARTSGMPTQRAEDFLQVWSELFEKSTFRIGVDHSQVMGAQLGVDCFRMVYDFDLDSMQFHCFPVRSFPSVAQTVPESLMDL